jgi:hypothetical protein
LLSSGVPERLPLCREVTVTSGDTEEESVILFESCRIRNRIVGLGRGIHLESLV